MPHNITSPTSVSHTLKEWTHIYKGDEQSALFDWSAVYEIKVDCRDTEVYVDSSKSFLGIVSKCPNVKKIVFINRSANNDAFWDHYTSLICRLFYECFQTQSLPNFTAQQKDQIKTIFTQKLESIDFGDIGEKENYLETLLVLLEKLPSESPLVVLSGVKPESDFPAVKALKHRLRYAVYNNYTVSGTVVEKTKNRSFLSAIGRFIDGLAGALVGLVLATLTVLFIYNPITFILASFNINFLKDDKKFEGSAGGKIVLKKLFFPILGVLRAGVLGYNDGLFNSFKMPRHIWKFANDECDITTSNILTPWVILAFSALVLGVVFGLVALGIITMPAIIPFVFASILTGAIATGKMILWASIGVGAFTVVYQVCCNVPFINRFFDSVTGMIIGPLLGIVSSLIIHNPVTCLLGALDHTYGSIYPGPVNVLRILISPVVFPLIAMLDHFKDGIKVGFKQGTVEALRMPIKAWNNAPYYTSEIVFPWAIAAIAATGGFGLIYGGVIAFSAIVHTALTYLTIDTLMTAGVVSFLISGFYVWAQLFSEMFSNYIESKDPAIYKNEEWTRSLADSNPNIDTGSCFYRNRSKAFAKYFGNTDSNSASTHTTRAASHSDESCLSRLYAFTNDSPTQFGRFFALPKDLSAIPSEEQPIHRHTESLSLGS